MDFSHYDAEAAEMAADLVNTVGSITGNEYLPDAEALRKFMAKHGWTAPKRVTGKDLEDVRLLRERLRSVFEAKTDRAAAKILNEILVDVKALPQITDHDGRWHIHYVSVEAPAAQRLAAGAAMGLVVVMSESARKRFGICNANNCRDVFVDTSRNRSRRYCDETCSSRTNVAAFRARTKARA